MNPQQGDLFDQLVDIVSPTSEQFGEFFNTIELKGNDLNRAKLKAGSQNEKILEYFRHNQRFDLLNITPSHVYKAMGEQWPLTSVRRAIHTLTKLGYLEKTQMMREGMYGMDEHCWRLKE